MFVVTLLFGTETKQVVYAVYILYTSQNIIQIRLFVIRNEGFKRNQQHCLQLSHKFMFAALKACVCNTASKVPFEHGNTLVSVNLLFHSVISPSCHEFQIMLWTVRELLSQ